MDRQRLISWLAGAGWRLGSSTYLAVGLLVLGWSPLLVILALWFETLLGLGVCLLRMNTAQGAEPEAPPSTLEREYASWSPARALGVGVAFLFGHAMFLGGLVIARKDELVLALLLSPFIQMPGELVGPVEALQREFGVEILFLAAEAAAGLLYYDVFRKEYRERTRAQAAQAYFTGGVALNHLIILFGVVGLVVYEAPHTLAVVIVAWKLVFDAKAYVQWRSRSASPSRPPRPATDPPTP